MVTEPGEAVDGALALAARIGAVGPVGVRASLRALERTVTERDELGWDATHDATAAIRGSEDVHEGVLAFFENASRDGRDGRWTTT